MEKETPLRILYGVQATGQGHITRARVMAKELAAAGAKVDFIFSGRPKDELYNMEVFGDFQTRRGMTFEFKNGKVDTLKTYFNGRAARQLLHDVSTLDLKSYDLVITDYEPVTAWAAKLRGVPSIGIGHQYAFKYKIPKDGFNMANLYGMTHFAPAKIELGVHWNDFGLPILPPIFEPAPESAAIKNKIVVYLNFESVDDIKNLLKDFSSFDFYIYHSGVTENHDEGHLKFRKTSAQFRDDLADCAGVICGAGFELPTETLHMGKKLLVKAMQGQPEQYSNALALKQLAYGDVMQKLDQGAIIRWLMDDKPVRITYPDTGKALAEWIVKRDWKNPAPLTKSLWSQVKKI